MLARMSSKIALLVCKQGRKSIALLLGSFLLILVSCSMKYSKEPGVFHHVTGVRAETK